MIQRLLSRVIGGGAGTARRGRGHGRGRATAGRGSTGARIGATVERMLRGRR